MTPNSEEFQGRLIERILAAPSQTEVKQIIEAEMKNFKQSREGPQGIIPFTNKIIQILHALNPLYYEADQWSNIKMARIHLSFLQLKMKVDLVD